MGGMESDDLLQIVLIAILVLVLVLAFARYILVRIVRYFLVDSDDKFLEWSSNKVIAGFLRVVFGYKAEKNKKDQKDD